MTRLENTKIYILTQIVREVNSEQILILAQAYFKLTEAEWYNTKIEERENE